MAADLIFTPAPCRNQSVVQSGCRYGTHRFYLSFINYLEHFSYANAKLSLSKNMRILTFKHFSSCSRLPFIFHFPFLSTWNNDTSKHPTYSGRTTNKRALKHLPPPRLREQICSGEKSKIKELKRTVEGEMEKGDLVSVGGKKPENFIF